MVHTGCPRGGETILSWGPLVYGDQLTRPIQYVMHYKHAPKYLKIGNFVKFLSIQKY